MRYPINPAASRALHHLWFELGVPLFIFAALSLALTWPTVQHFTTALTSDGADARHNLWQLWHVQQTMLGKQPLFYTPLLYYPVGISLLLHAVGPVEGLFALPFWSWGPEAAYNGALLIGLWFTGYLMYLLARGLNFDRGVALFAGMLLMSSPMPLVGLLGHIEKTFLGLLPLALLSVHYVSDLRRSGRWAIVTSIVLLLSLLHTGWHFVLAAFAIGYFSIAAWLDADRLPRTRLLRRGLLLAISALVLVGPFLLAIMTAASNPAINVNISYESFAFQPDLVEFFLPSKVSQWFGSWTVQFLERLKIDWSIESSVSLTWTGIALCLFAFTGGDKRARRWLLLLLLCMLFALGPNLKVLGRDHFTPYRLSITLPYGLLTSIPGFGFMRTPGHFMMMGFVAFGIAASFGLSRLIHRLPNLRRPITVLAIALVLVESWPQPWPAEKLRPVPQFYQQIAQDDALYGVFDLPIKPWPASWDVAYSSVYQMYQMTHRKGIASGYLSRPYKRNPLFPCLFSMHSDILVNAQEVPCYLNEQFELAHYGYRYVVWHKPQDDYGDYRPGSWGEITSSAFIQSVFGQQTPIVDDQLVRVYAVPPLANAAPLTTTMFLGDNWYVAEDGWRWAASPATLIITSPFQQSAWLQITPHWIHDPHSANGIGPSGVLMLQSEHGPSTSVEITSGETTSVPVMLASGNQTFSLSLKAGNFIPSTYGGRDFRPLSFAIRSINLQTLK